MERLLGLGRDVRDLSGLRLGAYREPAAQALQAYGLRPDCVARRGPADFNAAFRESNTWQVLLIQPAGGQSALRGELLAIGAAVETVAAYALAPAVGDRHLSTLQERLVDVVAFCSAPGLNSLAAPLGRHRLADVLAPLKVACAGRATVDAAHQLGVAVDVYSADETACGLVEALAAWRARS
jgi:uroporphyrinogen III methyltransferase/synthase